MTVNAFVKVVGSGSGYEFTGRSYHIFHVKPQDRYFTILNRKNSWTRHGNFFSNQLRVYAPVQLKKVGKRKIQMAFPLENGREKLTSFRRVTNPMLWYDRDKPFQNRKRPEY